ncbi:hypothetical protein CLF_103360 [Clonorchis sinensis]|uniref:Uncharacterized protein n=1 Tax=Clonorchis sinensis TaxID=79923 RepID=G7Y9M0_CLOSI|nr:hypothetical protein CLF_103360 [Clonorchis sinensis]
MTSRPNTTSAARICAANLSMTKAFNQYCSVIISLNKPNSLHKGANCSLSTKACMTGSPVSMPSVIRKQFGFDERLTGIPAVQQPVTGFTLLGAHQLSQGKPVVYPMHQNEFFPTIFVYVLDNRIWDYQTLKQRSLMDITKASSANEILSDIQEMQLVDDSQLKSTISLMGSDFCATVQQVRLKVILVKLLYNFDPVRNVLSSFDYMLPKVEALKPSSTSQSFREDIASSDRKTWDLDSANGFVTMAWTFEREIATTPQRIQDFPGISGSNVKEAVEIELIEIDDMSHHPVATFHVYYAADPGTKLQDRPKEFNLRSETTVEDLVITTGIEFYRILKVEERLEPETPSHMIAFEFIETRQLYMGDQTGDHLIKLLGLLRLKHESMSLCNSSNFSGSGQRITARAIFAHLISRGNDKSVFLEVRFKFPVPPGMTTEVIENDPATALSDILTKIQELRSSFDVDQLFESTVMEGFEFTRFPTMVRGVVNLNLYKLQRRYVQFDWTNPVDTFNFYIRKSAPFFMKASHVAQKNTPSGIEDRQLDVLLMRFCPAVRPIYDENPSNTVQLFHPYGKSSSVHISRNSEKFRPVTFRSVVGHHCRLCARRLTAHSPPKHPKLLRIRPFSLASEEITKFIWSRTSAVTMEGIGRCSQPINLEEIRPQLDANREEGQSKPGKKLLKVEGIGITDHLKAFYLAVCIPDEIPLKATNNKLPPSAVHQTYLSEACSSTPDPHIIIIDSMTSVFNTDASLPYNHAHPECETYKTLGHNRYDPKVKREAKQFSAST